VRLFVRKSDDALMTAQAARSRLNQRAENVNRASILLYELRRDLKISEREYAILGEAVLAEIHGVAKGLKDI
jgi:hypothetical protein